MSLEQDFLHYLDTLPVFDGHEHLRSYITPVR